MRTDVSHQKAKIKTLKNISDSLNIETLMGWSKSEEKDFTLGKAVEYGMSGAVQLKGDRKVYPRLKHYPSISTVLSLYVVWIGVWELLLETQ